MTEMEGVCLEGQETEMEEFRSFVTFQGIENKSEMLLYKIRLHGLLE